MNAIQFLMLGLLLSTAPMAAASWYQIECSNAKGTLTTANGHNENYIKATLRDEVVITIYPPPEDIYTEVELNLEDVEVEIVDSKDLFNDSKFQCDNANDWATAWWKTVSYQRVRITNRDGSEFKPEFLDRSTDGKALVADLICEENGNSMAMCPQP